MTALLDTIIRDLGPLGVALGAGLEGETAVVIGGALARHGSFSPVLGALCAWLGSFVADQLLFMIGRTQRQGGFVRRMSEKTVFTRAIHLIERHPLIFCVGFRFAYGFRIAGPVAIGVSTVPTRLFVILNATSAAVWAIVFTTIGFRFGRAFERLLALVLTPTHLAVAAGLALLVALIIVIWRKRAGRTRLS